MTFQQPIHARSLEHPRGTTTAHIATLQRRGLSAQGAQQILAALPVTSAPDRVSMSDIIISSPSGPSARP